MAVVGVRNVLVETLKTERNDGKKVRMGEY